MLVNTIPSLRGDADGLQSNPPLPLLSGEMLLPNPHPITLHTHLSSSESILSENTGQVPDQESSAEQDVEPERMYLRASKDFEGDPHIGQLSFKQGDVVEVFDSMHDDSWAGRVGDSFGTFLPSSLITTVWAVRSAQPQSSRFLTFRRGDIIQVLDSRNGIWWRGSLRGRVGLFPRFKVNTPSHLSVQDWRKRATLKRVWKENYQEATRRRQLMKDGDMTGYLSSLVNLWPQPPSMSNPSTPISPANAGGKPFPDPRPNLGRISPIPEYNETHSVLTSPTTPNIRYHSRPSSPVYSPVAPGSHTTLDRHRSAASSPRTYHVDRPRHRKATWSIESETNALKNLYQSTKNSLKELLKTDKVGIQITSESDQIADQLQRVFIQGQPLSPVKSRPTPHVTTQPTYKTIQLDTPIVPDTRAHRTRELWDLFAEGWCTKEFASLEMSEKESLLQHIPTENPLSLLFRAQRGIEVLDGLRDSADSPVAIQAFWMEHANAMINIVRQHTDREICLRCRDILPKLSWEVDPGWADPRAEIERVEWLMDSLKRGVSSKTWAAVYETLFTTVLYKTRQGSSSHIPTQDSPIRTIVQQTCDELIAWIQVGNRLDEARALGTFQGMREWVLELVIEELHESASFLLGSSSAHVSEPAPKSPESRKGRLMRGLKRNIAIPGKRRTKRSLTPGTESSIPSSSSQGRPQSSYYPSSQSHLSNSLYVLPLVIQSGEDSPSTRSPQRNATAPQAAGSSPTASQKMLGARSKSEANLRQGNPIIKSLAAIASSAIDVSAEIEKMEPEMVGFGGFCDIFIGYHTRFGKVALKRPRMSDQDEAAARRFWREAETWCKLDHPYVLRLFGVAQIGRFIHLVSPWVAGGSLYDVVQAEPCKDRVRLLREICQAIRYLHELDIIHGDIKAPNILIADNGSPLLCDFGLSKVMSTMVTSTGLKGAGSTRWMARELFMGKPRTKATDVYAVGMTIVEVVTALPPFAHHRENPVVMMEVVVQNGRPSRPRQWVHPSHAALWAIAERCWVDEPSERPTIEQVILDLESIDPLSTQEYGFPRVTCDL